MKLFHILKSETQEWWNIIFPWTQQLKPQNFVLFLFESDTVIDRILNFDHNKGGFSFCGAKIPIWLMFLELLLSFYTKWKCLGHPGQDLPLDNFLQRAANKRYLSCWNKKISKWILGYYQKKTELKGYYLEWTVSTIDKRELTLMVFFSRKRQF